MTPDQLARLAEIDALLNATIWVSRGQTKEALKDAETRFCGAMRSDIPWLRALVKTLADERDAARVRVEDLETELRSFEAANFTLEHDNESFIDRLSTIEAETLERTAKVVEAHPYPDEGDDVMPSDAVSVAQIAHKATYVGAPACFALEQACQHLQRAFGDYGCYLVGSAIERPDWRDVDVRYILPDEEFYKLFPNASATTWEFDARWLLLVVSISAWLSKQTGLPVDFQFQPQSHANKRHKKSRHALGLVFSQDAEEPQP